MRNLSLPNTIKRPPAKQRGVVLFIALIALVAMTLTGMALLRTIDTTVMAAGNMAFKQSSILEAEVGFATTLSGTGFVAASGAGGALGALNTNSIASGYYSTYNIYDASSTCATPVIPMPGTGTPPIATDPQGRPCGWPIATSSPSPIAGTVRLAQNLVTSNTVSYVVQRLCVNNLTGGSAEDRQAKCSTLPVAISHDENPAPPLPPPIYYRATAMVQGPHNTLSYVQTIFYVNN